VQHPSQLIFANASYVDMNFTTPLELNAKAVTFFVTKTSVYRWSDKSKKRIVLSFYNKASKCFATFVGYTYRLTSGAKYIDFYTWAFSSVICDV
jgi:hypothetical protein